MGRSALAAELRSRLPKREELSISELRMCFWPHASAADLQSLGELVEEELEIPIGILRPEDDMRSLLAPMSFRNPWRWYLVQPGLEDGISELNYRLRKRLPSYYRDGPGDLRLETWADVVIAWCGMLPPPAGEPGAGADAPRRSAETFGGLHTDGFDATNPRLFADLDWISRVPQE